MSPEICAAESYGWASDIWALGCVMYELCAKEPPFNAKTHLELIQRIRAGVVKPLPSIYSKELQNVIMQCIRTAQSTRPDTTQLLNLPMVKLKRKEMELVETNKQLQLKMKQAEQELERARQHRKETEEMMARNRRETEELLVRERQKIREDFDRERRATHDLSAQPLPNRRRPVRAPFGRAQTMIECSPADVHMTGATPQQAPSMDHLSLSPRRRVSGGLRRNIFASEKDLNPTSTPPEAAALEQMEVEEEEELTLPSPTEKLENPFRNPRPTSRRLTTAPANVNATSKPSIKAFGTILKRATSPTKLQKENRDPHDSTLQFTPEKKIPSKLRGQLSPSKIQGRSLVDLAQATIWDPERDEMPSPFLTRAGKAPLGGNRGGPGLAHLR